MNVNVVRLAALAAAASVLCMAGAALPRAPARRAVSPPSRPAPWPGGTEPAIPSRTLAPGAVDYAGDVAPIVWRLRCAQADCHGADSGKGGLKLSLFGAEPRADYEAITRADGGRRIDPIKPQRSLLLLKIAGSVPHAGKALAPPGSPENRTIAAWLERGAPWYSPGRPHLTGVRMSPSSLELRPGASARVALVASYTIGPARDVTSDARITACGPSIASAGAGGRVTARRPGQTAVMAAYLRSFAVADVAVRQDLPFLFPAIPANNAVDTLNFAHLKRLGIPPSGLCSDGVFVRRIHLDTIGLLPTPDEVKRYLADTRPDRRARLIDSLLTRPEFVDCWSRKWSDLLRIKSEYPVRLWPKAVQAYYRWVRQSIAENKPYDKFATELLTSSGSNFRSGSANFYRAVPSRDPQSYCDASALLFMGARLACARCHGHPYAAWSRDDHAAMSAFFAGVSFKPTQEWKEEIVYANPESALRHAVTGEAVAPRSPDGKVARPAPGADPRAQFARWLTAPSNPWFARSYVNRVWSWLIGRGLVEEPDDLRPTNPPSNPALLDRLAADFVKSGYDTRWLFRLILNSRTYQLSSATTRWNAPDDTGLSHYLVRRIGSEQMLDAIGQVTGAYEGYYTWIPEPYMHLPPDTRAQQVADGSIETPFLDLFGRSSRDLPYEASRCARVSARQAMALVNSSTVDSKVLYGTRMRNLQQPGKTDEQVIEELYLAALSRVPTAAEQKTAGAYLARDPKTRAQAIQDVMWAILNTKEFLFKR